MSRIRFPITLLGVAVVLSGCARSGNPEAVTQPAAAPAAVAPAANAPSAAAPSAAAPSVAAEPGVRAFLDPVTGEARQPTPAEAASAAAGRVQREAVGGQAASEGARREHFVLPDGTEGVKLAPRDKRAAIVCLQADGSYTENCPPAAGNSRP
jgi:hypothetical protein